LARWSACYMLGCKWWLDTRQCEGKELQEVLLECHGHNSPHITDNGSTTINGIWATLAHLGLDSWDQNDSFLNLNDCTSKRLFFNIGSKIPHQFANLVLICESQSNQRRPNLTWDLCFAFIDQMVPVNNLLQVIDLVIHIHESGVRSLNLIAIKPTGPPITQLDCN
jgi:hypothetical protein